MGTRLQLNPDPSLCTRPPATNLFVSSIRDTNSTSPHRRNSSPKKAASEADSEIDYTAQLREMAAS